jgi:hypothetical protein
MRKRLADSTSKSYASAGRPQLPQQAVMTTKPNLGTLAWRGFGGAGRRTGG